MSNSQDFETLIAAARDLYEGTHGITMAQVAEISGINKRSLTIYQRDQSWAKRLETKTGATTPEAAAAAEMFAGLEKEREQVTAEVLDAGGELSAPVPTEREALLGRHRKELNIVRSLMQQSLNLSQGGNDMKAFEKAKLAKITAETLTLTHNAERKAHGIDKGDGDHTVIIDRGGK